MPAAAVIPASIVYAMIAVVKMPVVLRMSETNGPLPGCVHVFSEHELHNVLQSYVVCIAVRFTLT